MRIILISLTILLSLSAQASNFKRLLKCLGEEESVIHRSKFNGPIYKLNQDLVNEIIQLQKVSLHDEYIQSLCNSKKISSSLIFLEMLMVKKNKIFVPVIGISRDDIMKRKSIEIFVSNIPKIFINYLNNLQVILPTADCLDNYIPGYFNFFEELRYLQTMVKKEASIFKEKRIKNIFIGLKNLNKIVPQCEADKRKQDQESKKK